MAPLTKQRARWFIFIMWVSWLCKFGNMYWNNSRFLLHFWSTGLWDM